MTEHLTVLHAPQPLPQRGPSFSFARRAAPPSTPAPLSTPMVMLTVTVAAATETETAPPPATPATRDAALLSPPINTFTARPRPPRPPRPASAPPTTTEFAFASLSAAPRQHHQHHPHVRTRAVSSFARRPGVDFLARPSPPLLRSNSFWRHTPRSGVTPFVFASSCPPPLPLPRRSPLLPHHAPIPALPPRAQASRG
ncbi:hypothetical protein DENSPDRAFT_881881 [Dentipellis sp. KUC8613]|nr:hypothetical protein DENSPDRAFT_881881 [Dentipellis sp. KUC8613]